MPATYATDGAMNYAQAGNDTGAASSGIGVAGNASGPPIPGNFTSNAGVDFTAQHIGNGALSSAGTSASDSNLGQIMTGAAITAGSGYTNGVYNVDTTGGGAGAVQGTLTITVAGGAIVSAYIKNAGGKFTAIPSVSLASLGAGTLGAVVPTIGSNSPAYALGAAYGTNKPTQRLTAVGAVAIGAVVTPSTYINRSPRALVAGDTLWAVGP